MLHPRNCKFTLALTNCGFRALRWHVMCHALLRGGIGFFANSFSKWSLKRTGIYIHPSVKMGKGVAFDGGNGTSICEGTVIGDNVIIGSNVTFMKVEGKAPIVKSGAVIESGSVIYGGVIIGQDSIVLSGTVLKKNVPMNCIAQGNPCILLRKDGKTPLRLISPVWEELAFLKHRLAKLERINGITFTEREEPSEQVYEEAKKKATQSAMLNTGAISSYDSDYEELGDELETDDEEEDAEAFLADLEGYEGMEEE